MSKNTSRTAFLFAISALSVSTLVVAPLSARDWAHWRGPEQSGLSRETDLPETWAPAGAEGGAKNLLWSYPAGGRSAPVAMLDRVYIQNLAGEGAERQERLMCFDVKSGKLLWEHRFNVFLTDIPDSRVGWANPVADKETGYVYVHGVQGSLKCLNKDGDVVWQRSLTEEFGRISGYGGRTHTPVIDEDRVVLSFLSSSWGPHGRGTHRYVAFDKRKGSVVWWSEPAEGPPLDTTYSCPVVGVINGVRTLITGNADGSIYALKSRTGEKIWRFNLSKRGLNASCVLRDNRVYVCHSEENIDATVMGRVVCIDATGTGDITKTHEVWRVDGVTAGYATPAVDDKNIYVVDNSANVHCYDAKTGKAKWEQTVGTVMKASPVVGDGKLYVGSVNGLFSILKIGEKKADVLSQHEFTLPDGRPLEINGSACIANGRVFFATSKHFYCVGESTWSGQSGPLPALAKEAKANASAAPTKLLVSPADVTLLPGQSAAFKLNAYDDKGRFLKSIPATWSVKGIQGAVTSAGQLTVASSGSFQGGMVVGKADGLEAVARVRVVPPLPMKVDFESGSIPAGWIAATPVKFQVVDLEGNKVFKKLATKPKFMLANCYFGMAVWGGYTIQADVMATEKRRQMPNIGLLNSRYEMILMGNHQRTRIVSWSPLPRVEQKTKFRWDPKRWYTMKLRVERKGKIGIISGKVWPRDESEPKAWTLVLEDPSPNFFGSPGLQGYSAGATDRSAGAEIFWDNIVVSENE